jgi:hypothetical protein
MTLAASAQPQKQIVVLWINRMQRTYSIGLQLLANLRRMIDRLRIDVLDSLTLLFKPICITLHRCAMQHKLLPAESILPKQQRILDQINLLDPRHPVRVWEQLMGVNYSSLQRFGFHDLFASATFCPSNWA